MTDWFKCRLVLAYEPENQIKKSDQSKTYRLLRSFYPVFFFLFRIWVLLAVRGLCYEKTPQKGIQNAQSSYSQREVHLLTTIGTSGMSKS